MTPWLRDPPGGGLPLRLISPEAGEVDSMDAGLKDTEATETDHDWSESVILNQLLTLPPWEEQWFQTAPATHLY